MSAFYSLSASSYNQDPCSHLVLS
uniref:Uncharacterized protein n=1 Tax=Arundo donax TaxID=35708 RepID=A0A0A9EDQ0_ARUDO